MEYIHRNSQYIILSIFAVVVISCKSDQNKDALIKAGQGLYNKTCFTCHLRGNNTLYQPSLETMSRYKTEILTNKLVRLREDTTHESLNLTTFALDSLRAFIQSYKKQDAIPY
jgi:hypothetical protein